MGVSVTDEQRQYVKTCMADAVALFPLNENVCKYIYLYISPIFLLFSPFIYRLLSPYFALVFCLIFAYFRLIM